MGDEREKSRALVVVGETEMVSGPKKTPAELIAGLMVTMSQSEKEWKDVFADGSPGMRELALGVRLARALKLPEEEAFVSRLKQMMSIHDRNWGRDFSFALVTTLLTDTFETESINRWQLPEMDEELRRLCVETIQSRLTELAGRDDPEAIADLIKIRDIITRSNPDETAWGYAETYLTEEDAEEIEGEITEEQQELINREQWKRLKMVVEALEMKKEGNRE